MSNKSFLSSSALYWGIFIIIATIYAVLTWVMPLYIDDWVFLYRWNEVNASKDFSFDGMARFFSLNRDLDNSRLSNFLTPFTTVFSPFKEIFPFINGLFYALMVMLVQKFSCNFSSKKDVAMIIFSWACLIVFLPWFDYILSYDYTLNYVWSSVVALTFILILIKSEEKGWTWQRTVLGFIFAFLTAGFHEGFGVPTLCGMGLWMIFRKGRMSWQFWAMAVIIAVVSIYLMLSKGMVYRLTNTMEGQRYFPSYRIYLIVIVIAAVCLLLSFFRKGREIISTSCKTPMFPICLGIFISGYVIGLSTAMLPRCYFYGNEALVIILLCILFNALNHINKRALLTSCVFGLLLICVAQSISVIYWQKRYGDECREVYSLLDKSENGVVFHDFKLKGLAPKYTLTMPIGYSQIWENLWQYQSLRSYYLSPFLAVLPKSLENADYSKGEKIDGDLKAVRIDGSIIAPFNNDKPVNIYSTRGYDITFNNGNKSKHWLAVFPFAWPNSTDTMFYMMLEPAGINADDILSIDYHK